MAANKLKPCPFCGGKVERISGDNTEDYFTCESCIAFVVFNNKMGKVAEAAWNRREEVKNNIFGNAHPHDYYPPVPDDFMPECSRGERLDEWECLQDSFEGE